MAKEKFEIGKHVAVHQDYVGSDDCFVCGKELKESDVEVRVALTENHTLSTFDQVVSEWYGTDWSPRVGNECVKRFPVESVFTTVA